MGTKIFNLIILDESGSMSGLTRQTISGCNETLSSIRMSQKDFAEKQEHFVSIYVFQSGGVASRFIKKNEPIDDVADITEDDYRPGGCTPLNDAIGSTLVDLKAKVAQYEGAIGSVTVITDGYENASVHFTIAQVARLIDELKELGWNFNFIGANIDEIKVASSYHIDNAMKFEASQVGTREMWEKERRSRSRYYAKMSQMDEAMPHEEKIAFMRKTSRGYFEEEPGRPTAPDALNRRIAPDNIVSLAENEVFVFGSNKFGVHNGGAAAYARKNFGARMFCAEGLCGRSYAIPSAGVSLFDLRCAIERFTVFARQHQDKKFLLTAVGCGNAGFSVSEVAPLFRDAYALGNVYVPQSFLRYVE